MKSLFGEDPKISEIMKGIKKVENLENIEEIIQLGDEALQDPSMLLVAVKAYEKVHSIEGMSRTYSKIKEEAKKWWDSLPRDQNIGAVDPLFRFTMAADPIGALYPKEDKIAYSYFKDLDRLGHAVNRYIKTDGKVSIEEGFNEYERGER